MSITRAEFNWVKDDYPTTIAFSRAKIWDANKIAECLENGTLRKPNQGNVPIATVSKVIKAALVSKELSDDLRELLQ